MKQKQLQTEPLNSPITTPYFKVKKLLSQSSRNLQKQSQRLNMATQNDKAKIRPIQQCSVKEMYQIINRKRRSGMSQYKPPRHQSSEKNILVKQTHKKNSNIFHSSPHSANLLHKSPRGTGSKFDLLTQYIKAKENSKRRQPGPGHYDSKIRSHTISFNLKRQAKRNSYLDMIQSNAKKHKPPSPSQYNIMGQFDKKLFLAKSDSQGTLSKANQLLQKKSLRKINYFDNAMALANQSPGVGQYKVNSQSMPKIIQKNPSWYFKKENIVQNRFKSPEEFENIRKKGKIPIPGPNQYKPNPQIKLFSNFPAKNKLKIDQHKLNNPKKLKILSKVGKNKQNVGPGDYLGLCQWNSQGKNKGFNQFKILHKGNPQSIYYS